MSAGKGSSQDFELNLASIIDCFTVLITYLLVSASFISLGALDVSVAANTAVDEIPQTPPLSLTVRLEPGQALKILTDGPEHGSIVFPPRDGKWDLEGMTGKLKEFQSRFPALSAAMVTADNEISYRDLVHTVETVRKTFPQVGLGTE
ncbi:MAG: ExbD/TolR family protein [Bdellovibrionota bacterium]